MNKQEAIEKIEKILLLPTDDVDPNYDLGYNNGLRKAKSIIEKIEPEKVKFTKAQEDYLLGFGDIENKKSEDWMVALYYIARVGWGYLFTTAPSAGSDEIPLNGDYYKKLSGNLDFDDLKTLLIKALVNGYEVEKEKLYTAKFKLTGDFLLLDVEQGEYQFCDCSYDNFTNKFTEGHLKCLNVWDDQVFEIKEAE